ncbi:SRPBCC family protein [Polluticaenibacter yanchengensis]|uniref:SRPBCC family protein n=1 Tax=Polluticaenibacter yanchengensis TaxID=3014562 RepID=A0ABT4UHB4_9BACT|nr:SRPBCC family protein [Chitinophagaceae bacterium LY-5]
MPIIETECVIYAPIEICFDLSTSIDVHQISTEGTNEKAIAGRTSGLITLGETVTWRARHFGIYQTLTSKITEYRRPYHFTDEMISGAFKSIKHDHYFEYEHGFTRMKDQFEFRSPLGILGEMFNNLVLTEYMKRFIVQRNKVIKTLAESNEYRKYLSK